MHEGKTLSGGVTTGKGIIVFYGSLGKGSARERLLFDVILVRNNGRLGQTKRSVGKNPELVSSILHDYERKSKDQFALFMAQYHLAAQRTACHRCLARSRSTILHPSPLGQHVVGLQSPVVRTSSLAARGALWYWSVPDHRPDCELPLRRGCLKVT